MKSFGASGPFGYSYTISIAPLFLLSRKLLFIFLPESHTTWLFPVLEDVGHENLVLSFLSNQRLGGLGDEAGGEFGGLAVAAGQSVTGSSSGSVFFFFNMSDQKQVQASELADGWTHVVAAL